MRQPVIAKVFDKPEMVMVRSAMPGNVARLMCSAPSKTKVLVNLVGEDEQVVFDGQRGHGFQLRAREDFAAGVRWRVDDDRRACGA